MDDTSVSILSLVHLKNHPHKLSLQVINKTVSNDVRAPHFDPVTYILQYPPRTRKHNEAFQAAQQQLSSIILIPPAICQREYLLSP